MAVPPLSRELDGNRAVLRLDVNVALASGDADGTVLRANVEPSRDAVERDGTVVGDDGDVGGARSGDDELDVPRAQPVAVRHRRAHAIAVHFETDAVGRGAGVRVIASAGVDTRRDRVGAAAAALDADSAVRLGTHVEAADGYGHGDV